MSTELLSERSDLRVVYLTDENSNLITWCYFHGNYDEDVSLHAIETLWDASLKDLIPLQGTIISSSDYPILRYLGRYQRTQVTKRTNGAFCVEDAQHKPTDAYLGIHG